MIQVSAAMDEHEWPADLDADARCERCGLPYGEWSTEDGCVV